MQQTDSYQDNYPACCCRKKSSKFDQASAAAFALLRRSADHSGQQCWYLQREGRRHGAAIGHACQICARFIVSLIIAVDKAPADCERASSFCSELRPTAESRSPCESEGPCKKLTPTLCVLVRHNFLQREYPGNMKRKCSP